MHFQVAEHPGLRPPGFRHSLYATLVTPRPIGWISTISDAGVINLAPFSFFNLTASDPLCCMYCANGSHVSGGPKDSLANVREVPEFVFNLCTWDLREEMNLSAANSPRDVNEMAAAGLAAGSSVVVRPPRVAASPIALECTVFDIIELPSTETFTNTMVMGRVEVVHIADEVVVDGMIDFAKMRPLGRLGYNDYTVVDNVFTMVRPD
ncbi:MAG: flavin reductase family protein [Acidimicrobiales bacterium]